MARDAQKQIRLDDNHRMYLETGLVSKKVFRMGIKNTYQKLSELGIGAQTYNVDIVAANRQFNRLEISLVSDKCNKHKTTYNSYNLEPASTIIQIDNTKVNTL